MSLTTLNKWCLTLTFDCKISQSLFDIWCVLGILFHIYELSFVFVIWLCFTLSAIDHKSAWHRSREQKCTITMILRKL